MRLAIRSRLDILIREKKVKTATNFGKLMTKAGYRLSTSQAARYVNDVDPPSWNTKFVETACNVLQCMPNDLFDITITTDPNEVLDPLLAIPQHAKMLAGVAPAEPVAEEPPPPPAPARRAKLPWEDKYGVAGPKMRSLPTPPRSKD